MLDQVFDRLAHGLHGEGHVIELVALTVLPHGPLPRVPVQLDDVVRTGAREIDVFPAGPRDLAATAELHPQALSVEPDGTLDVPHPDPGIGESGVHGAQRPLGHNALLSLLTLSSGSGRRRPRPPPP